MLLVLPRHAQSRHLPPAHLGGRGGTGPAGAADFAFPTCKMGMPASSLNDIWKTL